MMGSTGVDGQHQASGSPAARASLAAQARHSKWHVYIRSMLQAGNLVGNLVAGEKGYRRLLHPWHLLDQLLNETVGGAPFALKDPLDKNLKTHPWRNFIALEAARAHLDAFSTNCVEFLLPRPPSPTACDTASYRGVQATCRF